MNQVFDMMIWKIRNKFPKFLLFLFFLSYNMMAQTNISIFKSFSDSAANLVKVNLKSDQNFYLPNIVSPSYNFFFSQMYQALTFKNVDTSNKLLYTISQAKVSYSEAFKKNFFSTIYTERKIVLNGNYLYKGEIRNFSYLYTDTIATNKIRETENDPYIFTKGETPADYVYPSFLEPVLAIGVSAAIIIMFFIVRSK